MKTRQPLIVSLTRSNPLRARRFEHGLVVIFILACPIIGVLWVVVAPQHCALLVWEGNHVALADFFLLVLLPPRYLHGIYEHRSAVRALG